MFLPSLSILRGGPTHRRLSGPIFPDTTYNNVFYQVSFHAQKQTLDILGILAVLREIDFFFLKISF